MKWLFAIVLLLPAQAALAHVKWFSNFDFQQVPLTLSQIATPAFYGLFLLSLISLPLLVWTDRLGENSRAYDRINSFLDRYAQESTLIMRVAMGAVLLMSWHGDAIIAPEIPIPTPSLGRFQFILALLLLFKQTTPFTGVGMLLLYSIGIINHGFFHMLDYVVYPAVGLFLILSNAKSEKLKNLDLPVLYFGLGFSLCWVAFEKMIYPYWGLSVLDKAPALTMGLDHGFFLLACAFVEFTLGFLLIICLLHRPLAIIVTLTFFTTTAFFGKTEVVGHTILHGALLVFLVRGTGRYYQAPIRFHKSPWMRSLFAIVNYVILFYVLIFPYQKMSAKAHAESLVKQAAMAHPKFELPENAPVPNVMIHPQRDAHGGWNLHLMTSNFTFAPENSGKEDRLGEGHAHLYLNGRKIARVYGNWFHLNLPKGNNTLRVTLNTNSHKDYFYQSKPIEAVVELNEEREVIMEHHH